MGRLRIGATLTIGNYLAVPLMARFMRENPGAEVTLAVANTEEIARQVANFEIDVAPHRGRGRAPRSGGDAPGATTSWWCSAPPATPAPASASLTDEDLRRAAWIVREQGSGTRQTFDRAMRGLLPGLHIALALQHTEAIKEAVAAGLGLGCVSRIALQEAFPRGTLRPCRVPQRDFRRKFYFLLHRHKFRSAGITALAAAVPCLVTPRATPALAATRSR